MWQVASSQRVEEAMNYQQTSEDANSFALQLDGQWLVIPRTRLGGITAVISKFPFYLFKG